MSAAPPLRRSLLRDQLPPKCPIPEEPQRDLCRIPRLFAVTPARIPPTIHRPFGIRHAPACLIIGARTGHKHQKSCVGRMRPELRWPRGVGSDQQIPFLMRHDHRLRTCAAVSTVLTHPPVRPEAHLLTPRLPAPPDPRSAGAIRPGADTSADCRPLPSANGPSTAPTGPRRSASH